MADAILDGTATDETGIAVAGALVYVYDGNGTTGGLSDLRDSMGQGIGNPVTTDELGYWSAYAASDQFYTLAYYWGGRKRYVEANVMLGTSAINTDPNVRTDLASTTSDKGDALVGSDDGASGSLWTTVKGFIAYLRSSAGASVVKFLHAGAAAVARTIQDKLRETIDAADYGILPDGTDQSAAMQALVDYVHTTLGSGTIRLRATTAGTPYLMKWNHRSGVMVEGASIHAPFTGNGSYTQGTTIQVPPAGGNIISQTEDTYGGGVRGIRFKGQGSGTAARAIYLGVANTCFSFLAENLQFEYFADEGAVFSGLTMALIARNWMGENLILNNVGRSAPVYAFDFNTGDGTIIENIEGGPSLTALTDANKYVRAIRIGGTGTQNGIRANNILAEFGDISLVLEGQHLHIGKVRAEFSMAENCIVNCSGSDIDTIVTTDGSKAGDATYDSVVSTSGTGNTIGLVFHVGSNVTTNVRNVVNDTNPSGDGNKNVWNKVLGSGLYSQLIPTTPVSQGAAFGVPGGPFVLLTANSATPSANVGGRFNTRLQTNNSSATTITAITGIPDGALVVIFCADSNTTIQHNGSTFSLPGNANMKLQSGYMYVFVRQGALLRLVSMTAAMLFGSATYDAPSIAAGGSTTTTVTVTGAALGDYVEVSFGVSLAGLRCFAYVSAANTVTVELYNPTAGAIDLASTTLRATVRRGQ